MFLLPNTKTGGISPSPRDRTTFANNPGSALLPASAHLLNWVAAGHSSRRLLVWVRQDHTFESNAPTGMTLADAHLLSV